LTTASLKEKAYLVFIPVYCIIGALNLWAFYNVPLTFIEIIIIYGNLNVRKVLRKMCTNVIELPYEIVYKLLNALESVEKR
jgi:hypothetical protein